MNVSARPVLSAQNDDHTHNFDVLFGLFVRFILRPCQHDNGHIGHIFKSTPTNGPRFTTSGLPWWSPIRVLVEVDVPQLHCAGLGRQRKQAYRCIVNVDLI